MKQAGYDVSTHPFAQRLLDDLPSEAELGCAVSIIEDDLPTFKPEKIKGGRWFVAVKTGNGPDSHIGDFDSEAEARRWISTKGKY